jgi:hypothetical protein
MKQRKRIKALTHRFSAYSVSHILGLIYIAKDIEKSKAKVLKKNHIKCIKKPI